MRRRPDNMNSLFWTFQEHWTATDRRNSFAFVGSNVVRSHGFGVKWQTRERGAVNQMSDRRKEKSNRVSKT